MVEFVVAWNLFHYQQLCKDLCGAYVYSCSTGSLIDTANSCDELSS